MSSATIISISKATIISISNRALLSIGARAQISSLTEGSTEADAISVLFTPTFENLARTAYWNCLRKQATLSLIWAAAGTPENVNGTTLPFPPTPWCYGYQLPSDCLHARAIIPSCPIPAGLNTVGFPSPVMIPGQGQIPFEIAYGVDASNNPITVVLTNQSQSQLMYTVNQQNPAVWDSAFQQAMVSALAAYLVPALSLNLPLMNSSIATAERIIAQARAMDANEGTSSQDHIPDWIQARRQGYGYGWGSYGGGWGVSGGFSGSYIGMAWPGY